MEYSRICEDEYYLVWDGDAIPCAPFSMFQEETEIPYLDVKKLPESRVMFICTFDPFKKGLSKYTFLESSEEMPGLRLEDGTKKVFYNCRYQGGDIPEELQKLYEYVEYGRVDSTLTRKIEQAVDKGRKNALWRTQYMKEWVVIHDAREDGFEDGIEQGISLRDSEMISDMLFNDYLGFPYPVQSRKLQQILLWR